MITDDFFLSSIKLHNFAVYRDVEIDFDTHDPEKNLYLFVIKNGGGKTSLYHGIRWGFYGFGEGYSYKKEDKDLKSIDFMNTAAPQNEGYFVEIDFISAGKKYTIHRECTNPRSGLESIQLTTEDGYLNEDEARARLKLIIPPNYGHFFMFDGRDLATLTDAQNDKNKVENVIRLVGLEPLQKVKKSLESVERRLEREIGRYKNRNANVKKIQTEYDNSVTAIENYTLKAKVARDELAKIQDSIVEYQKFISDAKEARSFNENKNALNERKVKTERDIVHNATELKRRSDSIYSMIIRNDLRSIVKGNKEEIEKIENITETGEAEIAYWPVRERVFKECPSHCPICESSLTAKAIERLQNLVKSEDLNVFKLYEKELIALRDNKSWFEGLLDKSEPLSEYYSEYFENKFKLEEINESIKKIDTEIRNSGFERLETWQRNLNTRQFEEANQKRNLSDLEKQLEKARFEKAKFENKLKIEDGIDQEFESLIKQNELTVGLIEKIESVTMMCIEDIRNVILEESNAFFKDMTNKPELYDRLEYVDETSYSMKIIDVNDKDVKNISTGELQIVAMSFLLALSKCSGKNTPIVMDTPTTNLDDLHSEGIERSLAKLPNQIIFLAQPNEASDKFIKGIKNITARRYTTDFITRESVEIREVTL